MHQPSTHPLPLPSIHSWGCPAVFTHEAHLELQLAGLSPGGERHLWSRTLQLDVESNIQIFQNAMQTHVMINFIYDNQDGFLKSHCKCSVSLLGCVNIPNVVKVGRACVMCQNWWTPTWTASWNWMSSLLTPSRWINSTRPLTLWKVEKGEIWLVCCCKCGW